MATQVLCAWCEAERRAVPSDELERLDHEGALGGMCWTHALTQLLRTHSIPGTLPEGRRFLVVVERKSEALFVRLSELLLDEPRIQVLLDRRQRERRQRDLSTLRDRRRGDRRAMPDYWGDLRYHPVVIRPTTPTPDATLEPDRGSDVMDTMDTLTQPRQRLDDWMRQGTQLFGQLVEENEALQERVRAAEAQAQQVTDTLHELEREMTRLRGEIDDFKIQRGQVVEAVQSWVGEMGRLTNELLTRTRRH
ncbi:MAG: hypothetical protein DMD91_28655 [Candidatus Rokuibacteriota bacterium]|nr:MAG: hypothetical protein DMD91_28655 [Candidatus Rokubacteria bacterium]